MPEPEFEAYLTLLSKLLHLSHAQNAEIASELRDHLEERLHELQDQGHDRGRAIELALNELGDAAALAVDFTQPHLIRRRRQLMRYSLGSVAVITVTFVLAAFYWPAQRQEPRTLVIAQAPPQKPESSVADALVAALQKGYRDEFRQKIEDKLARRDVDVSFEQMPLGDVFAYLGDSLDLDFILDQKYLDDNGVPSDMPVTLKLRPNSAMVRTVLELVFRQVGEVHLSYVIHDGVVLITSPEESYEVQVYDCRDLLANVKIEGTFPRNAMGAGGGHFSVAPEVAAIACAQLGPPAVPGTALGGSGLGGQFPGDGGIGGGIGMGGSATAATSPAAWALINVIMAATGDSWLDRDGSGGTITEFDGLLIVRHSQRAHRNIDDLLAKLREKKAIAAAATSPPRFNDALLVFTAQWGPSKNMSPIISKLKQEGSPIVTIDVAQERKLTEEYGVTAVPSFLLVVDGRVIERLVGVVSENQLRESLLRLQQLRGTPVPATAPESSVPARGAPTTPPAGSDDEFAPRKPATKAVGF